MPGSMAGRSAGRRVGTFAVVLFAHLLLVLAFLNGLGVRIRPLVSLPVEVSMIDAPHPARPPPPPPPLVQLQATALDPTLPDVPMPAIHVEAPVTAVATIAAHVPVLRPFALLSKPDARRYIPEKVRLRNLTGHTLMNVCLDDVARVTRVQVISSSGFTELDSAALQWVHHSIWKPATLDGKPVSYCYPVRVDFILTEQQARRRARR